MEHIHEYNAAVTKLKMILDGENLPTPNAERTEQNSLQNRGKDIISLNCQLNTFA